MQGRHAPAPAAAAPSAHAAEGIHALNSLLSFSHITAKKHLGGAAATTDNWTAVEHPSNANTFCLQGKQLGCAAVAHSTCDYPEYSHQPGEMCHEVQWLRAASIHVFAHASREAGNA